MPLATVASHVDAVDVDSNAIKIMFVQNLTLKEKGFSFLAYFYRWVKGRHVTKRALLREAKQNNLAIVEQDHKAYFDCRKFEGYGFDSFFGCDFEAYTLTPVASSSSPAAGI